MALRDWTSIGRPSICSTNSREERDTGYLAHTSLVTRGIKVVVKPFYLDDQSEPDENHFVWAYHVEIVNDGHERVQLRTWYWRITDALGRVQEVRGPGVVGEQPVLDPGEAFEYTSGTPLPTPSESWPAAIRWRGTTANSSTSKSRLFHWIAPIRR